jgi:RNA polymerase sigma factor (sigma-70 family)
MSVRSIEVLQRYLRRLCDEAVPPEDAVLLHRFVAAKDRDAFALLIARHGPMVLGTARRLVGNTHDAEDVFQAVFLSLARLATRIRRGRALPAWLHQATCRIAAKVRKERGSGAKEVSPEPCEKIDPAAHLVWQEVRQALDEELQRLPERLRSPLVLCYLSGLTRDEAARQLGWSLGTLKRRLEEGRKALRIRLARRGIASVGLALTVLTPGALQAAVSTSLLDSTLRLVFSTRAVVSATIAALVLSSATTTKGLAMKSILALVAAVVLGVGIYAGMSQADPPKQAEGQKEKVKPAQEEQDVQRDDPLPAGSTLRFGTSRFRHGVSIGNMAVSADGKTAVVSTPPLPFSVPHGSTRAFDLVAGRARFTLGSESEAIAISPDGRAIVTKQQPHLHVFDSGTGKVLRSIHLPGARPLPEGDALTFTPDGKALATTSDGKDIQLIDFASGKTIRTFMHENPESALSGGPPQVLTIAFSPDGKWMASGGYGNVKDDYFARLWAVQTGKEVRRFMHGKKGYGVRSLAFSPDGKTLATFGTQSGAVLRLFDVDTGKERRAFPKDGDLRTRPGSVAFAPDGKTAAVASASIRVYDVATGEERLRIGRWARNPHFTDGGKTLIAAVDGAIYRWETATGKTLTPEGVDSGVEQVLVTPDGSRVITRDQDGYGHLWDSTSGKHLRRFSAASGWQRGMALSPDGRFLAIPVDDSSASFVDPGNPRHGPYGARIRLYDIAADKYVDRFPAFKGTAQDLAFTEDGKTLVTSEGSGGMVRIWDVEAGKEERSFNILPEALKKQSYFVQRSQLSPDGKTVVAAYEQGMGHLLGGGLAVPRPLVVRLWDVATGKELPELSGGYPVDKAFSPDGRLIVTTGGHVCHVATGKRVAALPGDLSIQAAAFSRDGRFLATAVPGGVLQIWEVAMWTKRNEFKGHRDQLTSVTFAPGGQLLSGSLDTTALAWDMRPPRIADSVSLESAWNALAAREAGEPFRSEGRLLSAPADAVKYFAERVKPVEALDPKRVQRLLADLDSDEFAVREAASDALGGLDQQAIPYLESTLKSTESAEVRERVQRILERRWGAAIPLEQLRQVRAVVVLERIGDGESKNLLKKWAGGPAGALLTMEAAAALKRLEAASKTKR